MLSWCYVKKEGGTDMEQCSHTSLMKLLAVILLSLGRVSRVNRVKCLQRRELAICFVTVEQYALLLVEQYALLQFSTSLHQSRTCVYHRRCGRAHAAGVSWFSRLTRVCEIRWSQK
jgi:hypothetical protein